MAGWFGLGSTGSTVAGVSAATVVVAGGMATYMVMQGGSDPAPRAAEPVAPAETVAPEVALAIEDEKAAPDPVPEPVPEAPTTPDVVEEPDAPVPTFDVVRVDAAGNALIAGRSAPRATVSVQIDGVEAHRAIADGSGSFAAFFEIAPDDAPRVVSLVDETDGEAPVPSVETVILSPALSDAPVEPTVDLPDRDPLALPPGALPTLPTQDPAPAPVDVARLDPPLSDIAPDIASDIAPYVEPDVAPVPSPEPSVDRISVVDTKDEPAPTPVPEVSPEVAGAAPAALAAPRIPDAGLDLPETSDRPTEAATPSVAAQPDLPQAPSVLLADETGLRVLQAGGAEGVQTQALALDTITYNPDGAVALGGRGAGDGFIRVYLDNKPIKTTEIGADGQWRTPLPEVDTGVYTLRVDELNAEGEVTSRVETPFKREEPEIVAALDTTAVSGTSGVITVQPGNTLWGLASERYGDGMLYVQVFRANRDRIRDPDLIYPGQIFEMPN